MTSTNLPRAALSSSQGDFPALGGPVSKSKGKGRGKGKAQRMGICDLWQMMDVGFLGSVEGSF